MIAPILILVAPAGAALPVVPAASRVVPAVVADLAPPPTSLVQETSDPKPLEPSPQRAKHSDVERRAKPNGRDTYAPNNNGGESSQSQLTQNRSVTPSRFNVRNQPVPTFASPYPAAALGQGPRAGPYFISRWAEDWSSLRTGTPGPHDVFDMLKFLPLSNDGTIYATFSGEQRARLNFTTNPRLRDAPAEEQYLLRNMVGADLHLGTHLRVFGELANGVAFGSPGVNASAQQDNGLIVQQLFVEASAPIGMSRLTIRYGRQEFMDGPPNVLHVRPAPNIYTSLDGLRVNVETPRFRASLFDFKTIALGRGAFDDPTNDAERFRGASTSFVVPRFNLFGGEAKLFFDPFVWNHRNSGKRWGSTTAIDDRNFYGARLWGTAGDATVDISVIRQDGSFGDRAISAWGVFANAGYLLDDGAWHPRIGGHLDYTSGGGAYTGGTLKTFSFFYGSIPYFSWGNLIGPSNLATITANMRFTPLPRVSVTTEFSLLRRANETDAVYNFLEAPLAGTQLVRGHTIGNIIKADIAWQANPHLIVGLKTDFLFAGSVLERAGYANSTYLGPEIQFRF